MNITDSKEITNYMFEIAPDAIKASFKMMFDAYTKEKSTSEIQDTKDLMKVYFSDREHLLTREGYEDYVKFFNPTLITHDAITGDEGDVFFIYKKTF